jgi:hypothetical protein
LYCREVTGFDCRTDNPFAGTGSDLALVSVDTLAGDRAFERLAQTDTIPYDLVVFDEAHKLTAVRNPDGTYDTTERYKLAELLAGAEPLQQSRPPRHLSWHASHFLLLTATPHMGKEFPYYALWRLLEPTLLRTVDAFHSFPPQARALRFLRRTKEEMVHFDGTRIYPARESTTASYELSPIEQELYDELTSYVRTYFNRARVLNRSAAPIGDERAAATCRELHVGAASIPRASARPTRRVHRGIREWSTHGKGPGSRAGTPPRSRRRRGDDERRRGSGG